MCEVETLYPAGACEITRYDTYGNEEYVSCSISFGVHKNNKKKY